MTRTPQQLSEILASVNGAVVGDRLAEVCHQAATELRRRDQFAAQLRDMQEKCKGIAQSMTMLRQLADPDAPALKPPRDRYEGKSDEELQRETEAYLNPGAQR